MISLAFAQTATKPQGGGLFEMFLPLGLMVLVFYFLLIRPQSKKAKEHQGLLKNLKKGDEVVTSGGVHGVIYGLSDQVITLEVDNNIKMKIDRLHISRINKRAE